MAQFAFNASNVPQLEVMEVLPAGWYNAKITDSKMEQNGDKTGWYLNLEFTILDGQFANRKTFTNVNIQHPNPVAAEIGAKTMSAICHSVGVIQIQDTQQLHGIPLQIQIKVRPAGPGKDGKHYDASNEIKGYKAYTGQPSAPAQQQQPAWNVSAPAPQQQAFQQPAPQAAPAWQPPAAPQFQPPTPQAPAWQPPVQQAPAPQSPTWQPPQPQFQQPAFVPDAGAQPGFVQQGAPQNTAAVAAPAVNHPQQTAPAAASHAGFVQQPNPAAPQPAPSAGADVPPWQQ